MAFSFSRDFKKVLSFFPTSIPVSSVLAICEIGMVFPLATALKSGMNICIYQVPPLGIFLLLFLILILLPLLVLGFLKLCSKISPKFCTVLSSLLLILFSYFIFRLVLSIFLPLLLSKILSPVLAILLLLSLRLRFVLEFMKILAFSVIIMPVYLIFSSELVPLIFPTPLKHQATSEKSIPPVLVVVFDELPNTSILNETGKVDSALFPTLASFSDTATFYPHTLSHAGYTIFSIPTIFSGKAPPLENKDFCKLTLPTFQYHPENIYTTYPKNSIYTLEHSTRFCTDERCEKWLYGDPIQSSWILFKQMLKIDKKSHPSAFSSYEAEGLHSSTHKSNVDFVKAFSQQKLDDDLYFIHLSFPHHTFHYLPSGKTIRYEPLYFQSKRNYCVKDDPNQEPCYRSSAVRNLEQNHLYQTQYSDKLLGDILKPFKEQGLYDKSLIIITSDHGINFKPGVDVRSVSLDSLKAIAPVPLFVKYPHQKFSKVDASLRFLNDIAPTILELTHKHAWPMDGTSLLHPRRNKNAPSFCGNFLVNGPALFQIPQNIFEQNREVLLQKLALFGTGRENPELRLLPKKPFRHLLGQPESALKSYKVTAIKSEVTNPRTVEMILGKDTTLPVFVEGRVLADKSQHYTVVVLVNGVVQGIQESFNLPEEKSPLFSIVVPESAFKIGSNSIRSLVLTDKK